MLAKTRKFMLTSNKKKIKYTEEFVRLAQETFIASDQEEAMINAINSGDDNTVRILIQDRLDLYNSPPMEKINPKEMNKYIHRLIKWRAAQKLYNVYMDLWEQHQDVSETKK